MPVYRGKEEKAPANKIESEEKIEPVKSAIPAPDVLKNPVMQTEDVAADEQNPAANPDVSIEEPEKEIKEEEPLKV